VQAQMKNLDGTKTRWLIPFFGAVVTLSAIYFLYSNLNLNLFLTELKEANSWWIVVLGIAILLEQFIQGWKWRQLLFDLKPISSWRLTGAILAGYGANVLVPLGISPLVRSWLVARLENLHMATILVTTAISRFIDGIVFAIFAAFVAFGGHFPEIEGNLHLGLIIAAMLNFFLFSGALYLLFRLQIYFRLDSSWISRRIDWLAAKYRGSFSKLRVALAEGIVWPNQLARQVSIIAASIAMKMVSTTHFLWAGFAIGVTLDFFDYIFLMVFAGFALVLARFIRVPGGFLIGSGFALKMLGVPDEQALVMILFNHMTSTILVVIIGLAILWKKGIDIGTIEHSIVNSDSDQR
jgi:uncharacterized membrane protein YbhN (UPF0104 family)